jgi:hypothetical protein
MSKNEHVDIHTPRIQNTMIHPRHHNHRSHTHKYNCMINAFNGLEKRVTFLLLDGQVQYMPMYIDY